MKYYVKIPGDLRSDMASDEEIISFLVQKVGEKYPRGEVEDAGSLNKRLTNLLIRTTPASMGVYNTFSCTVSITRSKDGGMKVEVSQFDADGLDLIQMILALFTIRKRGAFVEEVAGWLASFFREKLNPSGPAVPFQGFCSQCGSPLAENARFCNQCGAPVGTVPPENAQGPSVSVTKQERLARYIQEVQQKHARVREEAQRKRIAAANKEKKRAELEKWKETWRAELASLGDGQFPGTTKTLHLPGNIPLEMAWCPPGTFLMGSPMTEAGREKDETQHEVTLTRGFWIAKTPLTRIQWNARREEALADTKAGDLPVTDVSWTDANDFCHQFGLALPTEAQWEYACRGGGTGPYGGNGTLDEIGWFADNSGGVCHPVGLKAANAWGIHDMHGNVGEWCQDWMAPYQAGSAENPQGPACGYRKIIRGGSIKSVAEKCRSARRNKGTVNYTSPTLGFRPVKVPKDVATGVPTT